MDVSAIKRRFLEFEQELRGEFSEEDISSLRQDLRLMGMRDWVTWLAENMLRIESLASASPSERRAELRNQVAAVRLRFLLGALLCTLEAIRVFEVLESAAFDQQHPPRDLIPIASEVYHEIRFGDRLGAWPFGGVFPFEELT